MKKIFYALLSVLLLLSTGAPFASAKPPEEAAPVAAQAISFDLYDLEDKLLESDFFMCLYKMYAVNTFSNLGVLSRINAQAHLKHNKALDPEPAFITSQNADPVASMRYGTRTLSYNGCELVAVYNALLEFGRPKKLSDIVYHFECAGSVWLEAEFGTKIAQYKRYLKKQGLTVKEYREAGGLDAVRQDGDVFIVTYQNWMSLTIHTIMVKQVGGKLEAYNTYPGPYDSFVQMMDAKGNYLLGFKISA